jgi:hypothetical protein
MQSGDLQPRHFTFCETVCAAVRTQPASDPPWPLVRFLARWHNTSLRCPQSHVAAQGGRNTAGMPLWGKHLSILHTKRGMSRWH